MTYPSFYPPKNPQYPLDITNQPRLIQSQLGPGDSAYSPDGINVTLLSTTLKFEPLAQAEYNAIDTFFTTYIGQPFFYTLPDEATPRLWLASSRVRRAKATTWGYEVSISEQPII
jgi:phage-related protein